ncbi:MAG: hypothetical protein ABIQ44_12190, partial [Chloroflexia bacterium]
MTKETARRSGSVERGAGRANARGGKDASAQAPVSPAAAAATPDAPQESVSTPKATTNPNGAYHEARPYMASSDQALLGRAGLPIAPALPTTSEYLQIRTSRRRRLQRFAVFLAIVALIAETAWLSPFTDGPAIAVPRTISAIPLAEVQKYGVNTFLHKEVEVFKKDKTFQAAEELGVGWIKQQFPWAEIEYRVDPGRPYWDVKNNQNAWTKFDDIVTRAERHNIRIIARIDSAPLWSHPDNSDAKAPPDADHMADFAAFVSTFAARYRGSVAAIQVWNEPNLRDEWGGSKPGSHPANAAEYT